jgi:hypothetical protein
MLAVNVGAQIASFVTNPVTARVLANMQEATAQASRCSNRTRPISRRRIFGVTLRPPRRPRHDLGQPAERLVTAVRGDAQVKTDRSVFTSNGAAVRPTRRVGFGLPHPAIVVKGQADGVSRSGAWWGGR